MSEPTESRRPLALTAMAAWMPSSRLRARYNCPCKGLLRAASIRIDTEKNKHPWAHVCEITACERKFNSLMSCYRCADGQLRTKEVLEVIVFQRALQEPHEMCGSPPSSLSYFTQIQPCPDCAIYDCLRRMVVLKQKRTVQFYSIGGRPFIQALSNTDQRDGPKPRYWIYNLFIRQN